MQEQPYFTPKKGLEVSHFLPLFIKLCLCVLLGGLEGSGISSMYCAQTLTIGWKHQFDTKLFLDPLVANPLLFKAS